jgi:hypothetical protein
MFKRITAAAIALVILSACAPSKQYAGSAKDGAFFSVPNGWTKVDQLALHKEEAKSTNQDDLDRLSMVSFQVGFTKLKTIAPRDVFLLEPTKEPVLYARFRDLFPEERNAISLNTLRNVILPVTEYVDGTRTNDRNFQLYDDQEITERGGRGVNLRFSFDNKGISETINQTALYSNDQGKIYLLIIRCSTECFNKNVRDIDQIIKSFTVRGAK